MIKKTKQLTYISLFSSAGVGCYGFKQAGFECIATNEFIERRLNIQKLNNKCTLSSGYIDGDLTNSKTKSLIYYEIEKWHKKGNDKVDVVIATPPCQGMSVANHKKTNKEIIRNSLVVESIKIVKDIMPRFFVFENVAAFMKTGCTAPDGKIKTIGQVIYDQLGQFYTITSRVLNFKNYGSNSSRTRTIVIGVHKSLDEYITPLELYPPFREEITLRDVIGNLPKLEWGDFCPNDFYHQFRTYPKDMRLWIKDLTEGHSAFENDDPMKKPHKFVQGEYVANVQKNGGKYTRQYWDKVGPCIHTRNDQLASQNTIHPEEDRVFSIRELMLLMTIPNDFKWIDKTLDELNKLTIDEKKKILKKEEINIRQCIGEAVPTVIFNQIANNIKELMLQTHLNAKQINDVIKKNNLYDKDRLKDFIKDNQNNYGYSTLARIAELTNSKRENNSAYFTNKFLINEIVNKLPTFSKREIRIIEPSVGVGNFLPLLIKKYEDIDNLTIDICDIDGDILEIVKILLKKINIPKNVKINYICDNFLTHKFEYKYDLVVGNPPFTKMKSSEVKKYLSQNENKNTTNLFEFFLEKATKISQYVTLITPKSILNTPEFSDTRKYLNKFRIDRIIDFGEQGFKGVLVETICLFVNTICSPSKTEVVSVTKNTLINQEQKYIFDEKLPYWIIYRDSYFDNVYNKMDFGLFDVFRDRQITNSVTSLIKANNTIQVLKSRNIDDRGKNIITINNYDSYIDNDLAKKYTVYKFIDNENVLLTPNMTYNPRVIRKPKGYLTNGSIAILIPKDENLKYTDKDMEYISSEQFRKFYQVARNFQTRSLNIDSTSVYWFGKRKDIEND